MAKNNPDAFEDLVDFAEASRELAPSCRIKVEGDDIPQEVTDATTRVVVDLTRDIADLIEITFANPIRDELGAGYKDSQLVFIDSKAFQPGNRIDVLLGYGGYTSHVCSGIVQKWLPDFPNQGVPTLTVKCLDGSSLLMDGETSTVARTYPDFDLDTVVLEVLNRHGIQVGQVDPVPGSFQKNLTKKQGMTDYQFVKGLANLAGFEFKVRWDDTAKAWKAFWRKPNTADGLTGKLGLDQSKQYTFRYGGDSATLLEFRPQWGLRDSPSEVKVLYFDQDSRTFEEVQVGDRTPGEDLKFPGGKSKKSVDAFFNAAVSQEITSMSRLRVAAGDVAIEVIPERRFTDATAAQQFAERWLRARADSFILGTGDIVGLETLQAGDVHVLQGIGTQLSGEWEFTQVRHVFDARDGYKTNFTAHKIVDL